MIMLAEALEMLYLVTRPHAFLEQVNGTVLCSINYSTKGSVRISPLS